MASFPPPQPNEEENVAQNGGETHQEQSQAHLDAANGGPAQDNEEENSSGKTLEIATELFDKGSKSIEDGDFVDAVDCLSRSLEIRVAHYGELAPECAIAYYKYGCALLYKSQEEADPLGNVPKNPPANLEKDRSLKTVGDSEGSKASASDAKECNTPSNNEEVAAGTSDKDQEDDDDSSDGDGEELADADEEDSDLDLAWKMLDVARAIVEKCPNPKDTIDKVNIFSALGEVSLEREDFETSLSDYLKALSILERLVEPDNRRIIELNFRISLVLEVWSKVEEAIPYCEKAISLCKSCLKRLSEDVNPTALQDNNVNIVNSGKNDDVAEEKGDADPSVEESEEEVLTGVLSELERKLEDLHHILSNPRSMISELIQMAASKSASVEMNLSTTSTESRSASLNSSQLGVVSGGFDSPMISTAATATNGGSSVTHLGVVGRGVKRASLNPIGAEPFSKQLSLDTSSEKDGSSVSEIVDSAACDAENQKK